MDLQEQESGAMPSRSAAAIAGPSRQEIDAVIAQFGQGRYVEAEALARKITARFPQHGFGWKALGAVLKQQRRQSEALGPLAKAAQLMPQDVETHFNLGNALLEHGKLNEAATSYRNALVLKPDHLAAQYNLGNVLQAQGQYEGAEASYRAALAMKPDFADALGNLAVVLHAQGRFVEAEAGFRQLLAHRPGDAQAHINLANVQVELRRVEEAETSYRQALAINPDFAVALCHLGVLLREQGRIDEAATCYRRALEIDPGYAEAHNNLGNVLRQQGRMEEAAGSYGRALALRPDYTEALYNLGNVYKDLGRYAEAEENYRRALELAPDYAKAHSNLANALKEQGRLDEAIVSYEAAIAIKPDYIESHYGLSSLKTYRESDPHLAMLEQQRGRIEDMPTEAQIRYWFTLGKVLEDMGRFDEAFSAYREGNRLQHARLPLDEAAEDALLERMLAMFSRAFFASRPQIASDAKAPIFIVGMPRSGTSLIEQILATCPGVHGAGELADLSDVVNGGTQPFPEGVAELSAADFLRMGNDYTERVWKTAPEAARITDKMPANFLFLGMIHLMLPNARIVHAMRDPMDSCFSCYSRLFNEGNLSFAYDLETLGRYYARYIKLMRHWHDVLPPGTILDIRYEDMVADTETQARRLLDYLGLPWDDRCLAFHQNKRRVITASAAQVRKPIYRTSLARWERFRPYLAPLHDLVGMYRD